jgi:nitrous oxidase accessory protein
MLWISMRKSIISLLILVLFVSVIVTFFAVKAQARIIIVPDDYPTIADALHAAADGDSVFVKRGTYEEDSLVINKTLALIGEDSNTTIIHNPWKVPSWDPSLNPFPPQKPIALQVTANNVKILGFTITGNIIPISIHANRAQIVGNAMDSIEVHGNNNTISQNIIKTYVKCTGSYNNFASNPLIGGGSDGFLISGSFNVVYNNNLSGCTITVTSEANTIAKNSGYLFLRLSSDSSNNIVYGNRISGDLSLGGFQNTFYANEIGKISIIRGGSPYASDNIFYHNNILDHNDFLNETPELWVHTKEPGLLVWDYCKEGNYWRNYRGEDTNGDGIGDTPYNVTAAYSYYDGAIREEAIVNCGQDNYPLMVPFVIDSVAVQLPNWISLDFLSEQSIEVLSPQNTTYIATNVALNFSVPESAKWVRYSIDGKDNITVTGNTTLTELANGSHHLTVYADDPFGKTIVSEPILFSVEVPFPTALVATVSAASVIIAGVGLLVYFKKRKR